LSESDTLLWDLAETARQLGVCQRTVRRMLDRGVLPRLKMGRTVRIPRQAVERYVQEHLEMRHNQPGVEPAVRGGPSTCHIDAKTGPSGGRVSPTRAAKEVDALLERRTGRKRRP